MAPVAAFDLVVTTPQYGLAEAANVLHNLLPLHPVSAERLAAAARWAPRLAHLPRPFVTVLVGGSSGPYVLDAAAAARLGREASALARRLGGSVLVTTSARTAGGGRRCAVRRDRRAGLPASLDGGDEPEIPISASSALADRLVVTADSISMIAEACATGRPVQLFDFGSGAAADARRMARSIRRPGCWRPPARLALRALPALPRGPAEPRRDLRVVHRALLAAGRVSWLGEPLPQTSLRSAGSEMTRTVNRLRDLLRTRRGASRSRDGARDGSRRLPSEPARRAEPRQPFSSAAGAAATALGTSRRVGWRARWRRETCAWSPCGAAPGCGPFIGSRARSTPTIRAGCSR